MNTCYVPGTTLAPREMSQISSFNLFKIILGVCVGVEEKLYKQKFIIRIKLCPYYNCNI